MIEDAIKKAKNNYQESKEKEMQKRTTRPVTTGGFLQYFHDLYSKYNYGTPPLIKKQTKNKLSGTLRLLKNNYYDDQDIYKFLDDVFKEWDNLARVITKTDNRKSYIMDDRPNLEDIVNTKNQILRELGKEKEDQPQKSLLEMWRESD